MAMKTDQLLQQNRHRPWELPKEDWKFYQEWNNAIFMHWQVDPEELKKHVPAGIEIDLFEGKPWVSLVAFTMEKIRPRYLPPFSPVSYFHEVNIRTYSRNGSKAGVYFLSMEGSKWLSCQVAKGISGLPYRYSEMKREENSFLSYNSAAKDHLLIDFSVRDKAEQKSALDKWLTERYALHQDYVNSIYEFEVHHIEWPVQDIKLKGLEISYPRFEKLLTGKPQLQHYSQGVQVLAWDKIKVNS